MVWPIVAAGIGAAGGMYGADKEAKARKSAERDLDALTDEWRQINMPHLTPVEFEQYKNMYLPEMQQNTEMSNIQVDPVLKAAQMDALSKLGELSQGGLSLQDKADLAEIQNSVAQQDAGRQSAIMQNMAERGIGGSGMELAQRLSSQQASGDRAASDARHVAGNAQSRALQAIMQRGQMGGDMRAQEFGEKSAAAKAQDIINQYNTGSRNQAGMMNQETSNMNTDLTNQQMGQGNVLAQQDYENRLNQMQGITGVKTARAGAAIGAGEANSRAIGAGTSGISQMIGSYYGNKKREEVK